MRTGTSQPHGSNAVDMVKGKPGEGETKHKSSGPQSLLACLFSLSATFKPDINQLLIIRFLHILIMTSLFEPCGLKQGHISDMQDSGL